MGDERSWWQAAALAQTTVTVTSAALSIGFFVRQYQLTVSPGRRLSALALTLTALGAASQALVAIIGPSEPARLLSAGTPACLGQVLVALLVARQMMNR